MLKIIYDRNVKERRSRLTTKFITQFMKTNNFDAKKVESWDSFKKRAFVSLMIIIFLIGRNYLIIIVRHIVVKSSK